MVDHCPGSPPYGSKVIYFIVRGNVEKAQISAEDDPEAVKDLFRSAAGVTRRDIIKLYDHTGALVPFSPRTMRANTADRPHRLDVVSCCPMRGPPAMTENAKVTLSELESRVTHIEERIANLRYSQAPDWLAPLIAQIDSINAKLKRLEIVASATGTTASSGCGTRSPTIHPRACADHHSNCHTISGSDPKVATSDAILINSTPVTMTTDPGELGQCGGPSSPELVSIRWSETECEPVWRKFQQLCLTELTPSVRASLRVPAFDNWVWTDPELLFLLRQMFLDLDLHLTFSIDLATLDRWLFAVYSRYNRVPFHNFKHAFMVAQMMYALIRVADLPSRLDQIDILILLFSAVCHDLDHPGFNNTYQVNARTQLALRYNDVSPLENHHCAITFELVSLPDRDILRALTPVQRQWVREAAIRCILATDMAKHAEIVSEFCNVLPQFDLSQKSHKLLLMVALLKLSDISNEARPPTVAGPWLECLLQEFFRQSDGEKLRGLPVAPFMDREKVTKANSQCGFIQFVILPLFEAVGKLLPAIEESIIQPVRLQLAYYTELQRNCENPASTPASSTISSGPSRSIHTNNSNSSDRVRKASTGSAGSNSTSLASGGGSGDRVRKSSTGSMMAANS